MLLAATVALDSKYSSQAFTLSVKPKACSSLAQNVNASVSQINTLSARLNMTSSSAHCCAIRNLVSRHISPLNGYCEHHTVPSIEAKRMHRSGLSNTLTRITCCGLRTLGIQFQKRSG